MIVEALFQRIFHESPKIPYSNIYIRKLPSQHLLVSKAWLILWTTLLFAVVYLLDRWLLGVFVLFPDASLIHLPSGVKLVLVLLMDWIGAVAIFNVSLLASLYFHEEDKLLFPLCVAAVKASTPWLTRRIFLENRQLLDDLSDISRSTLLRISLVFALLNSVISQLIWQIRTDMPQLLDAILVSFIGDLTGIWLVLFLLRLLARYFLPTAPPD